MNINTIEWKNLQNLSEHLRLWNHVIDYECWMHPGLNFKLQTKLKQCHHTWFELLGENHFAYMHATKNIQHSALTTEYGKEYLGSI